MDTAAHCVPEGKPEKIASRVLAGKVPEVEKLRKTRGEVLYNYDREERTTDHFDLPCPLLLRIWRRNNDFKKHQFPLGRDNLWQSRFLHSAQ
jgi:hypothetical protein